jgi:hypothetical protein
VRVVREATHRRRVEEDERGPDIEQDVPSASPARLQEARDHRSLLARLTENMVVLWGGRNEGGQSWRARIRADVCQSQHATRFDGQDTPARTRRLGDPRLRACTQVWMYAP